MKKIAILRKCLKVVLAGILGLQISIFSIPVNVMAEELEVTNSGEEIIYLLDSLNSNSLGQWQFTIDMSTHLPKVVFGSLTNTYEGTKEEIAQNFIFDNPELTSLKDSLNTFEKAETIHMIGTYIVFI